MKRSICGPTTMLVKHGRLCLVTSSSTIQSGRIQVLTRGRQRVFTITICRRLRQHETAPPLPGPHPVGLTPSLREAPATAQNEPNRQRIHLAEPKRCLDEAGHLWVNRAALLSLSHGDLIALVQAQQAQIEAQARQISVLTARIAELEG